MAIRLGIEFLMSMWQLDFIERFSHDLEEAIMNQQDVLIKKYEKETKDLCDDALRDYWDFHEDEFHDVQEGYPNFLRGAILVMCYSVFEKTLVHAHEAFYSAKLVGHYKDIKEGSTISKIKTSLEKVFPFPCEAEWERIDNYYREIRNWMAHDYGRIINPTTKQLQVLQNMQHVTINTTGDLAFSEQFCEMVIRDMKLFLNMLQLTVANFSRRNRNL